MRILHLYNQQRSEFGGEETAIARLTSLFSDRGHEVLVKFRSSRDYTTGLLSKARAFADGIHNPAARRWLEGELASTRPDIVHLHSLYPALSPAVLLACRDAAVPVVMSVHSQVLTCPAWYHMRDGEECEKCLDGGEQWCVWHNCLGDIPTSIAYATRNATARISGVVKKQVAALITMNAFHRERLLRAGFRPERVVVIRHSAPDRGPPAGRSKSGFVGFAGRLSHEKGAQLLVDAARALPNTSFRIAGTGPEHERLAGEAPPNVRFVGRLDAPQLREFYEQSRVLVVPSRCSESGPLVVIEAFERGVPVIASETPGGLAELVQEGETGWKFHRGDVAHLAATLEQALSDHEECERRGRNARAFYLAELSEARQYERLLALYEGVIGSRGQDPGEDDHDA